MSVVMEIRITTKLIVTVVSPMAAARCVVAVLGYKLSPPGVAAPQLRERCATAARVAGQRGATIIPTGGDTAGLGVTEAAVMAGIMEEMGVARGDMVLEEQATNTQANAFHVLKLVEEMRRGEERVVVVVITSKYHMPKATWSFRQAAAALGVVVELEEEVAEGEDGTDRMKVKKELRKVGWVPRWLEDELEKWGLEVPGGMEGTERMERELEALLEDMEEQRDRPSTQHRTFYHRGYTVDSEF